jgi:hypothetical protein
MYSNTHPPAPSPFARSISDNEKGGTTERAFSLEEPLLIVTTHFKIEFACAHSNAIDTFLLAK